MPSTKVDKIQINIFGVFAAYVLIQTFILARDERKDTSNIKYESDKTSNITYTVNDSHSDTVLRLSTLKVPTKSAQTASHIYCDGRYKIYSNLFVVLSKVIIDSSKCIGKRKGGENVSDVLNQNESDEYCNAGRGFFKIVCNQKPYHPFRKGHFRQWDASIENINTSVLENYTEQNVTLAIIRQDYANLYWVIVDLYNIYHVTKLINLDIEHTEILIVDAHPKTPIDKLWFNLFPKVSRVGHFTEKVLYSELVWGMRFSESPLLKRRQTQKLFLQEFRHFVLSKLKHIPKSPGLNCKNITITIVFRKDYVAHARNPSGSVKRKMSNDLELLHSISNMFKDHNIRGVQLDLLPIEEQIHLASQTDILVGMHGAGLSHVMFLPNHAALVELFPWNFPTISHFEFIANWRNLTYTVWKNNDKRREIDEHTTTVDIPIISAMIYKVYNKICPNKI